ncbi:hypothetical protein RDABS01_009990, partial [Bienertia sinuspersici]
MGKSFDMIAMLIKSCPLLETLEMTLDSLLDSPHISIVAPNLKSLSLIMINLIQKHQVIIDSPKLTYLCLVDCRALINFVMDPTELDSAYIDLTYLSFFRRRGMDTTDFVREISKFWHHRISGLSPCFPQLEGSFCDLNYEEGNPLAHMTQSDVGALELLLNSLECVNIRGLQGNNDEVQLVGYILKNTTILNELLIEIYVDGVVEDEDARVGKELKFCKACFRLPRSSSTTWVVFSGQYIRAKNDTITSRNEI